MKHALLLIVLAMAGCLSGGSESPPEPRPEPVAPITEPGDLSLEVSAEASLVATLRELLGDEGEVVLNPSSPIVVKRPSVELTIRPGSSLRYALDDSGGSLVFADPKPTVSAKVWGLRVSPRLARLDLTADNTGTAHVEAGPVKLSRRFSLAWADEDTAGAAVDLPSVRMYTADWCGPCRDALAVLDSSELPFAVEYIPEPHPGWVRSLPQFEWTAADGQRWGHTGWSGLDDLVGRWRNTRGRQASASSGPEWTFPGSTRADLLAHLRTHSNHAAAFAGSALEGLSFAELVRLHSHHHNTTSARPRSRTVSR